ncbi:MAG: glycoside hydrolase family 27 protein [Planctomycetes bacterium]|nr:glycoside hydrolase family 27 protein [Planctomycetota bacterium]
MLAQTPPMGWNSWNTFGSEVNEQIVRETADAFVDTGLKEAGYEYVVVDDFWEAPERGPDERLHWDESRFPEGIPALADYVHSKGLKFGIYSCAGTHTCGVKPASFGYEETDAQTFAEWGVDFLKYDFCYAPLGVKGQKHYERMGQALRATGRPILFSVCEWGSMNPWNWGSSLAGAHMWRTTGDINDSWESMANIGFEQQKNLERFAGPGHWNDPDMLIVGMHSKGNVARGGCTDEEYRTHFSLWCMLAAPLMIGCDVRNMNDATTRTLMAPEVIAVNQDPLGRQGYCLGSDGGIGEVWKKPLADGSVAVGLFNRHESNTRMIPVSWDAIGIHDRRPCVVRDLWREEDLGEFTRCYSSIVEPHDCKMLRIIPQQ